MTSCQLRPGVNQIVPISITGGRSREVTWVPPLAVQDGGEGECSCFDLNPFLLLFAYTPS